jgi:hypothetical protein
MYLQELDGILLSQVVQIKYDCDGGHDRCGKEWEFKLKDAKKNFEKNDGKHICRKCTLKTKNPMFDNKNVEKIKKTNLERYGTEMPLNSEELVKQRQSMFEDEDKDVLSIKELKAKFLKNDERKRRLAHK